MFVFFGGWQLFDFNNRFFIAIASCAFIIAVIASILFSQEERIEQLEKRVKELEEKNNTAL